VSRLAPAVGNPPRRALVLRVELQADTMPALVDSLVNLIGTFHEANRVSCPPEMSVSINHVDRDVTAALHADYSMTPERYRTERALYERDVIQRTNA
jgi:hypothetical protein